MEQFAETSIMLAVAFTFAVLLATLNERLVEFVAKPILVRRGWEAATPYVALATGLLWALAFGIDLITPLADAAGFGQVIPYAGQALTGLAIGAGSHFLHDWWPGSGGGSE